MKNFDKIKQFLKDFKKEDHVYKKHIKSKLKKTIIILFFAGIAFAIILSLFVLFFYINWRSDREVVLKQAEIYYNQILKETDTITRYQNIGGQSYQLKNIEEPIRVLDFQGEVLGEFSNEKRSFLNINSISPYFFYALFSVEDTEFYNHTGVNYSAIFRAFFINMISFKTIQGGSTLTQQLSKLLFTDGSRSLKRKIYEFFCARELEKIYTKEDILLMYSNLILFGHGAYGVQFASQLFFKKNAKDLDLGEASFLVGLISNPSRYSPFLNKKNTLVKHKAVLDRMVALGYLSEKNAGIVYKKFWRKYDFQRKDLAIGKDMIRGNSAPYVLEEVRRFLIEKFGEEFFLQNRGATIYTTIDKRLEMYSADVLKQNLEVLRKENWFKNKKKLQGAVLFTVPETGEIRVLLGGEEFTRENQLNRATQSYRQVGSSMKPFFYLSGLENRVITPYSVFEDKPANIEIEGAPENVRFWKVGNYKNEYKGFLTVTEAVYRSSNVVAAQVSYLIGVDGLRKVIKDTLNLSAEETDRRFPSYQYSLALGTAELSPLELNMLFMMIANKGVAVTPYLITKVVNNKSRVLYEASPVQGRRIVSKEADYLIVNILRRVFGRGGTGGRLPRAYGLDIDIAGKTGTTQHSWDAWFNGINASLAGTVWIGHDENKAMGRGFTGGVVAGPIWAKIMKQASIFYNLGSFSTDSSYRFVHQPVCLLSGKAVVKDKCKFVDENALFIEGTEPGDYCDLTPEEENKRALMKGWIDAPKEDKEATEEETSDNESGGF